MSLADLDVAEARAHEARRKLAQVVTAAESLADRDRMLFAQLQALTTEHGRALADAAMGDANARATADGLQTQIAAATIERDSIKVASVEIASRRAEAQNAVTTADNAVRAAMHDVAEPLAAKLSADVRAAFAYAYGLQRQWAELCYGAGLPWDGANFVRHRLPGGNDDDVAAIAKRAGINPDTLRPIMPLRPVTAKELRTLAEQA